MSRRRTLYISTLLYRKIVYKRLSLRDMSRLRCFYIWDMSRRQYIRKITKSKGYEPAMVNMAKLM